MRVKKRKLVPGKYRSKLPRRPDYRSRVPLSFVENVIRLVAANFKERNMAKKPEDDKRDDKKDDRNSDDPKREKPRKGQVILKGRT